jgi:hypothetical protein
MAGRTATAALAYSTGCSNCLQTGQAIRVELRPIGITVQLKPVDDSYGAIHDHPDRYDMKVLGAAPTASRERAAAAFLAGPVTDQVPATGLGYSVTASLLSPRLGCRVFTPFVAGPDLAALCPAGTGAGSPG